MAKYHINKKGEPGVCRASYSCPLGGEDEHYGSAKEAAQAYEKSMTDALVPAGAQKDALGLATLNKLAKVSTDREVLEAAVSKGSDRTLKTLAQNASVGGDLLVAARHKASDPTVKDALLAHRNYPVARMSGEDFARAYKIARLSNGGAGVTRMLSDDGLTDEHLAAMEADPPKDTRGNSLIPNSVEAISNINNKLSAEKRIELAERSWSVLGAAQRSGIYPADRIKNLDASSVYWGNVYRETNPTYIKGYGDWAVTHASDYKAEDIARHVAQNEHAPAETLDKLARNGFAPHDVYKNPNTSNETKDYLASKDATSASLRKLEKLQEAQGGKDLKTVLRKDGTEPSTAYPSGRNRGYSITTMNFDPEKVKAAGLTASDIHVLMDSRRFNAGSSYNEKTGVYSGAVDSTD